MRDLRIVFMGTPDFAVATLKALVENKYKIVCVITAPDKPAGRGQQLHESAVKQYAKSENLPILQPINLKSESFIEELKAFNANLQIVVAFRMLPKIVWQMPEYGTFNLHASILPNYRGAAPINWAIINGEEKTGVSTFFINEDIDTGDMIFQQDVEISIDENAGSLHDKLMNLGSALVLKTVSAIAQGEVKTIPQNESVNIKPAHKLNKENCKIQWEDSIDNIYNLIRGLSPYPAAWCTLINGKETLDVKIYASEMQLEHHNLAIGNVVSTKKELKVAVSQGFIIIKEIKLPGKRLMDVSSLLNGYMFHEHARVL